MPSTISCTHNFDFNHVIFDSAHVASLATAFAGIPDLNSTGRTADDNGLKPDGRKKIKGKLEKPPVLQHNSTQPLYIGVDLSHKYYQVAVADDTAFYNICLTPDAFTEFIRNNAGRNYCIAMEACGSSNYWSSFAGQNGSEPMYSLPMCAADSPPDLRTMPPMHSEFCTLLPCTGPIRTVLTSGNAFNEIRTRQICVLH